jgi:hypothetical protein
VVGKAMGKQQKTCTAAVLTVLCNEKSTAQAARQYDTDSGKKGE